MRNLLTDYILVNVAGLSASVGSIAFTPPAYFYEDTAIALLGGMCSMAGNTGVHRKLWSAFIGVAMACGVAIILRSTELAEWMIRASIFLSAVLGIQIVYYVRHPKEGKKFIKDFSGMITNGDDDGQSDRGIPEERTEQRSNSEDGRRD